MGHRWVHLMGRSTARCEEQVTEVSVTPEMGWAGVQFCCHFSSMNTFRVPTRCQTLIWTLLDILSINYNPSLLRGVCRELWSHKKSLLTFSNTPSCVSANKNPRVEKRILISATSAIWGFIFRKENMHQVPEFSMWNITVALIKRGTCTSQPWGVIRIADVSSSQKPSPSPWARLGASSPHLCPAFIWNLVYCFVMSFSLKKTHYKLKKL